MEDMNDCDKNIASLNFRLTIFWRYSAEVEYERYTF